MVLLGNDKEPGPRCLLSKWQIQLGRAWREGEEVPCFQWERHLFSWHYWHCRREQWQPLYVQLLSDGGHWRHGEDKLALVSPGRQDEVPLISSV